VDTTKVGSYTITYKVTDAAGNQATPVRRTARVVEAALPAPAAAAVVPIEPARYWDTRDLPTFDGAYRNTGRLAAGSTFRVPIAGRGAVPADAVGVVANLTVLTPDAEGYATLFPGGKVPTASMLNYLPGEVWANNA